MDAGESGVDALPLKEVMDEVDLLGILCCNCSLGLLSHHGGTRLVPPCRVFLLICYRTQWELRLLTICSSCFLMCIVVTMTDVSHSV